MFGREFDTILATILAILMVVFFMGKGEPIMDLFGSKNDPNKKKRTREEERQYQRYIGFFLLPFVITEIITVIWPVPVMGLVIVVVAIVDLVVFTLKTRGK